MTEEEFALLSAAAALGALDAADEQAYRRALAEHPEWALRAADDVETATRLAELVDEVPPPPALRAQLFARIEALETGAPEGASGRDAAAAPDARDVVAGRDAPGRADDADVPVGFADDGIRPRRGWGARAWFALAASFVLLVGIGAGTVITVQHLNRPAAVIALDRIEAAPDAQQATADVRGGGEATLHWSVSTGQAVLVTGAMPALPDDRTFELWYVREGTPIPAGTFDASGGSTSALLQPGMRPGDVIAVTVEQSGGSPDGAPTTDPIVAIPTV